MEQALIIGGGVAGLTCAVALADSGVPATLLERAPALGGRAASWRHPATGDVVDIGPHVLHSEYRNFPALLERLGTLSQVTWQPGKVITIADRARPVALRHGRLPPPLSLLPSFLRAPGLTTRDILSNSRATWLALKFGEEEVPRLDSVSALDLLRAQGVTPAMVDWFWRLACMAVMNVPLERCSAAALMRVHAQLIGHRRLHFGFPALGLAELYAEQAARVVEQAGGRVLLGADVRRVEGGNHGHTAVLADGTRIQARYCVLAVPPADVDRLAPDLADTAAFEPSPYVSTYLWFDRKITGERFWAHRWSPQRLNYDFYDLSGIRRGWSARPSVVASNVIYSHRAHGMTDDEIVAATVREIAEFASQAARARVLHAAVHRIPMAIACPTPGSESRRPDVATHRDGVFLAGDWVRTGLPSSMESAAFSGFRAAEYVLRHIGRPRQLALPPRPADGLARVVRAMTRRSRALRQRSARPI